MTFKPAVLFGRDMTVAQADNAFKPAAWFGVDFVETDAAVPANTVAPVISGSTEVGAILTVTSQGTWTGSPTPTLTIQWQVNGVDVVGEVGSTFDTTGLDADDEVTADVTGTNVYGSDLATSNTITLAAGGDVTAPVLSSPTDAMATTTTSTGSVTTDEGNGTLYWVVSTASNAPSKAQVKAGQMHTGAAAADSGSQAVSGTGVQTLSPAPSGLTVATQYYTHFMHEDAATNQSNVSSADGFISGTLVTGDYTSVTTENISAVSYKVCWMTASGDIVTAGASTAVDSGVIDGGGTGGRGNSANAGGGGSGCGVETVTRGETLTAGTYPVVVGAAATGPAVDQTPGTDGNQSSFNGHVGGGVGQGGGSGNDSLGAGNRNGQAGVNGSGGGADATSGTFGDGSVNDGGAGFGSATGSQRSGGGGGGAGGAGTAGVINVGGTGGASAVSTLTDTPINYGAGGGGSGATIGAGGTTGGGSGGTNASVVGSTPTTYGSASGGCRSVQPAVSMSGLVRVCFINDGTVEVTAV